MLYNNPKHKKKRRYLRENITDAENIIWFYLRNKKLKGLKFYRQYGIDDYIVDFYCPKLRLVIEITR